MRFTRLKRVKGAARKHLESSSYRLAPAHRSRFAGESEPRAGCTRTALVLPSPPEQRSEPRVLPRLPLFCARACMHARANVYLKKTPYIQTYICMYMVTNTISYVNWTKCSLFQSALIGLSLYFEVLHKPFCPSHIDNKFLFKKKVA